MIGLPASRTFRRVVLCMFVVACASLWATRGIFTDKEALKYIGCAEQLLHGDVHDLFGSYAKYASYVLFLVPFIAIGAPWLAVVVQATLAVVAAFALARIAERITGSLRAGDAAFTFALLCYPFQEWVLALYTESFFASTTILFLDRITRQGPVGKWTWPLAMIVLFARPVGALFVLPACIWKFATGRERWFPKWIRNSAYAAVLLLAISVPGVEQHQLAVIVEGHVICGFPERPGAVEGFHGRTILAAQQHLFEQNSAGYAAGLFVRRSLSLFTLGRSYFSTAHNVLLLPFYGLFVLAVIGVWYRRKHPVVGLLAALLLLYTALIGFTYDEWNGRFLVPVWPIIILFASLGVPFLLERRSAA
ncbi:MAG: hypothetical protein WAU70_13410 [Flavobacteriales bacterium]